MRKLILAVVVLTLGGCGWGTVHPGERAVFTRWGKITSGCEKEGLYFYNPFTSDMYVFDTKVQKHEIKGLSAASQDLQEIHADLVLNFSIDSSQCQRLLAEVGRDFKERVVVPAVSEVLKASTAHFPIEKVIQERVRLKDEIVKGLQTRLAPYLIHVQDVALTNFEFSKAFAAAIEQKQVEAQNVQRKEYERQQAEKEAASMVARARGQAESNLAIFKAQADGNRLVRESLTPELIHFTATQRWNGQLPQIMGTGGAVPFVNIDGKGLSK